jgi:hypothetical protein
LSAAFATPLSKRRAAVVSRSRAIWRNGGGAARGAKRNQRRQFAQLALRSPERIIALKQVREPDRRIDSPAVGIGADVPGVGVIEHAAIGGAVVDRGLPSRQIGGMLGRLLGRRSSAVTLLAVALGCGRATTSDETTCRTDDDCDSGERCEGATASSAEAIYGPCPYVSCGYTGAICPEGTVCRARYFSVMQGISCGDMLCLPPCDPSDAATCPADQICRDDGTCSHLKCDEPGGITCSEHWRCDPDAAGSEPMPQWMFGSTVQDPSNVSDLIIHGCVRKRCSEEGGYACIPSYGCSETDITDGSGCVALPCEETGHCSDDEKYICEPTSSHSREPLVDANGCVWRNCEEGYVCGAPPFHYCDPTAPNADVSGCVIVPCTEGNTCILDWICDPSSPLADAQGCVVNHGDPGTGGSSGAGGGSGTSGSGTAGQGAAGTGATSGDDGQGRCVER